jgi:hypothetical protein
MHAVHLEDVAHALSAPLRAVSAGLQALAAAGPPPAQSEVIRSAQRLGPDW